MYPRFQVTHLTKRSLLWVFVLTLKDEVRHVLSKHEEQADEDGSNDYAQGALEVSQGQLGMLNGQCSELSPKRCTLRG
jgi:hypothetical protein